jgi:uncharacterized protein (DUF1330 family)
MTKGYIVANVDVRDPHGYEAYRAHTQAIVERHGGRFLVRGGKVEPLEGDFGLKRLVILEFPSLEAARGFYESPEYQAILPHRTNNSEGQFVLVEGWDG